MTELGMARIDSLRAALVPTARTLLVVNEAIAAYFAWYLLPIDIRDTTVEHLYLSAVAFAALSAVALVGFGGWKAACLSLRWRTEGSLVWAWSWLVLYAGFGAVFAVGMIHHSW